MCIFSWYFNGWYLAIAGLLGFSFSQIQSYLYILILLILKALLNGSLQNNTIAPFGFIIRFNCSHIGSKGITESHLQAVVQYGGSVMIQSILPSGIRFIHSRQSSLNIWFIISIFNKYLWANPYLICPLLVEHNQSLKRMYIPCSRTLWTALHSDLLLIPYHKRMIFSF